MKILPLLWHGLLLALLLASSALTRTALAQDADDTVLRYRPTFDAGTDHRETMWRLEMGYRGSFVTNAGYNPFSTDDYFSQYSVALSRTLFAAGRFSFAPGLGWDYGSSAATARGDATSFAMHRLSAPLEGRVHFGEWGYAFVRGAPGVAMQHAELQDSSSPVPLSKTRWLFSTDVSAGWAWLLWPRAQPRQILPRLWLQADGGYGWVAAERLALSPELPSGDPRRISGVDLGTMAMQGAFFRVAAAMSF